MQFSLHSEPLCQMVLLLLMAQIKQNDNADANVWISGRWQLIIDRITHAEPQNRETAEEQRLSHGMEQLGGG